MKKYFISFAVCSICILSLLSACNNGQNNSGMGNLTLKNISVVDTKISFVVLDPEEKNGTKTDINESVSIGPNELKTWPVISGIYTILVSCDAPSIAPPASLNFSIASDETKTLNFVYNGENSRIN